MGTGRLRMLIGGALAAAVVVAIAAPGGTTGDDQTQGGRLLGRRGRRHRHPGPELGGTVLAGPFDTAISRDAVIADPGEAVFSVSTAPPGTP